MKKNQMMGELTYGWNETSIKETGIMESNAFWNEIFSQINTYKKVRDFKGIVKNTYNHSVDDYKTVLENWTDLYVAFYKYAYTTYCESFYSNVDCNLYNLYMFYGFSPAEANEDNIETIIKKHQKEKFEHREPELSNISAFFEAIYDLAKKQNCFFGKKCDWNGFFNNLDKDIVLDMLCDHDFEITYDDGLGEFSSSDDQEEEDYEDIDEDEIGEYIFDELSDEYPSVLERYMPYIRNVDDFNGIMWTDLKISQEEYASLYGDLNKPAGLLDTAYCNNRNFIEQKFGVNEELDAHVYYNIVFDILRFFCMDNVIQELECLSRRLLTANSEYQETVVKNNKLDISKRQEKLLRFFFRKFPHKIKSVGVDLTRAYIAHSMNLESIGCVEKSYIIAPNILLGIMSSKNVSKSIKNYIEKKIS